MWFLRPSAPATILQSYDQNISNTIRKTGTKHWPQTLFQHLGGVDSLQLYHSTGRFTARIRTDTIRRLALRLCGGRDRCGRPLGDSKRRGADQITHKIV